MRHGLHPWIGLPLLALLVTPASIADDEGCWQDLHASSPERQLACLDSTSPTGRELIRLLSLCDASTDHRVIAGLLERIRAQPEGDPELAEQLVRFLPHQHPIYQERDRWQVIRLRAYLIATLTDTGFPDSGLPWLADSLIFVDERMAAVEVGSAVRAAGTLGRKGRQFLPYMLRMLGLQFAEEEFSLSRYDVSFPPQEATTVQLEVLRAVEKIGRASDGELLKTLRAVAEAPPRSPLEPRVITAARHALRQVEQRTPEAVQPRTTRSAADPASMATPWRAPAERPEIDLLDVRITDHKGTDRILGDLIDRPALLVFFYTRCQNAGKCSMSVGRLAHLQRGLRSAGIDRSIRLLAITFEPAHDTPERLKRFVQDRGLVLGEYAMTGRIHEADHQAFIRELDIPVSYSAGWVNTHGVEAVLLDAAGRLTRRYAANGWTVERIAQDLERLGAAP